nr:GntR family transcriptional regulator [Candidatus Pantoea persica]
MKVSTLVVREFLLRFMRYDLLDRHRALRDTIASSPRCTRSCIR